MNNELVERIDHCLIYNDLPLTAMHTLKDCKAALTQQQQDAELDAGMKIGTRYEYTQIGSSGQKWWGCVLVGFDGAHPLIRTDTGRYHQRPLSQYRFRTAKEEGK